MGLVVEPPTTYNDSSGFPLFATKQAAPRVPMFIGSVFHFDPPLSSIDWKAVSENV